MSSIRTLFEATRNLDRRIEKVISFDRAENEQLRHEITEYVVTDSIEPELRDGKRVVLSKGLWA